MLAVGMLATTRLGHQSVFDAGEVEHGGTEGMLAAEFGAIELAAAQNRPQAALGLGLGRAPGAGVGHPTSATGLSPSRATCSKYCSSRLAQNAAVRGLAGWLGQSCITTTARSHSPARPSIPAEVPC